MAKLNALQVKSAKPKGEKTPLKLSDGNGLYLIVKPNGSKHWLLRVVMPNPNGGVGKPREFGLGSTNLLSLAQAREKVVDWRKLAKQGIDPKAAEDSERHKAEILDQRIGRTFRHVADEMISDLEKDFVNAKHRQQWRNTLSTYAYPSLGDLTPNEITAAMIMAVVRPHWRDKRETMQRVLRRIIRVLNFANIHDYRDHPAPDATEMISALGRKRIAQKHHSCVEYPEAPAVIAKLRNSDETMARIALEFGILAAARSGEIRLATWSEIDFDNRVWTIPAERMKAKRLHNVPLVERAIELLEKVKPLAKGGDSIIFQGQTGKELSDMTLLKAQKVLAPGTTQHGWRSTFRDWVSEETNFDGNLAEMALAHAIRSKSEAAYRRGHLLEKRRHMMDAWANYLDNKQFEVSSLDEARAARSQAG
ncbi:MAG: integrase arm-type DNA-binding domain-containing protein [Parasphingorhabdus sp.]|uniref:tyrosine-type recombinase/integrase n=1 Tax=Parasphingorhabdus sp. TaxID=2709688 RepID=UPI003299D2E2